MEFKMNTLDTLNAINAPLTVALKTAGVMALISAMTMSASLYTKLTHQGPSCEDNVPNFNYWISKDTKNKEVGIVSVHENKLQVKDGSTTCFGTYITDKGDYRAWSGEVEELMDGKVIGKGRLL